MRTPFLPIMLVAAVLAAAIPGSAAGPRVSEDADKIILENDDVVVWFHGKKPMLKVFPQGNESGGFGYKFTQVVEYRDLDADGVPSEAEVIARLSLEKASAFEVVTTEVDGVILLNLTLKAPIKVGSNAVLENVTLPEREAIVTLLFAIRGEDTTLDADGVQVNVLSSSIKYDFLVHQWPFVDAANDRLALDMQATGDAQSDLGAQLGTAAVAANGTAVGILSWTATARGVTTQGVEVPVPVKAALKPAKEGDANATRIVFTYDAPGLATLAHDPTIGVADADAAPSEEVGGDVGSSVKTVPSAGLLVVLGVAGLAAVIAKRKK